MLFGFENAMAPLSSKSLLTETRTPRVGGRGAGEKARKLGAVKDESRIRLIYSFLCESTSAHKYYLPWACLKLCPRVLCYVLSGKQRATSDM